jgi:hypothetical protein
MGFRPSEDRQTYAPDRHNWGTHRTTTEQLREFALEHAEDPDAFSEAFAFRRKK